MTQDPATRDPATQHSAPGEAIDLFDGRTLAGWHAVPRTIAPRRPGEDAPAFPPDLAARMAAHTGRWTVEDGAVCGYQDPPGSGLGAYLVSDETFGDFELTLEARPDWPADTGIMLRCTPNGAVGYQVLVDHRKSGTIGGFYGNGIGRFHAVAFATDARRDDKGNPVGLRLDDPATSIEPVTDEKRALLSRSATGEEFLRAWRWNEWNALRITCRGALPTITTEINGTFIAELDAASLPREAFDPDAVLALLGSRGHIAFEVHDNDPRLGKERWGPHAACRWRNVRLRPL